MVGFAIADLKENNIWALFLLPDFEGKGIGKKLHNIMMDWFAAANEQTRATVWLGAEPNTRAEGFYRTAGWKQVGMNGSNELKFEMSYED